MKGGQSTSRYSDGWHTLLSLLPKVQPLTYGETGAQASIFITHHLFQVIVFHALQGIWQNRQTCELGSQIPEQTLAFPSVWRYFFSLYRILIQVVPCTVWIIWAITFEPLLSKKKLLYSTIRQLFHEGSLESQDTGLQVPVQAQKHEQSQYFSGFDTRGFVTSPQTLLPWPVTS